MEHLIKIPKTNIIKSFKMKISSIFISTLMLCAAFAVNAQTQPNGPLKFSLNEAREYALKNSPVLLNSTRDVEIAKKMIWENTATGLPQANLNGSYAYSPELAGLSDQLQEFIPGFNPNDLKTSSFMSIQVDQLLFSGQYIVGLKAAQVYASLSKLAETKSKIGIVESITNTYFTALVARQSSLILDSTLRVIDKTLFESEQMYKNGFLEQTDVDQIRILESNIKSSLAVTTRQIGIMERMLKFQMGLPIDQAIELTDQIDPLVVIMNLETAVIDSFNVEENIDYNMLDTQEKLRLLNYKLSRTQYLPTLSGYYTYYKSLDHNFFNDMSPNTFGLSLSFPLFSSGKRSSQESQRLIEYLKAKTNKQMGADNLLIQFQSALSGFMTARDVYALQTKNRDLALRIYKKSIIKFKEGMGSSLDLNQTQQQFFTAEGTYFNALMALVEAKSKLDSLLSNTEN
jgi:outer membrane protein